MTHRERVMNTIEGKASGLLPFIPCPDLWHKANELAGTLLDEYRNATIRDITDGLDACYHCLLTDFSDFEDTRLSHLFEQDHCVKGALVQINGSL